MKNGMVFDFYISEVKKSLTLSDQASWLNF